jgi:hypothetical protein
MDIEAAMTRTDDACRCLVSDSTPEGTLVVLLGRTVS